MVNENILSLGCAGKEKKDMACYTIDQLQEKIVPVAHRYGVKSVSLFGSYANGDARSDSDVDLLIEKGNLSSLFQLCSFRLAVEDELSLSVDLVTTESSDQQFLSDIQKDRVMIYGTS